MPSGYTHGVSDGSITGAKEYITKCARAFGALIMMRDEPLNAEIPEEFQPSTHQKEQLEKEIYILKMYQSMSPEEAQSKLDEEHDVKTQRNKTYYQEQIEIKNRYVSMLAEVYAWQPPNEDHHNLKDFCIKQLKESINLDCSGIERYIAPIQKVSVDKWLNDKIEQCVKNIEYYTKEWNEEVKRTNDRNKWVKELRESLNKI